jgi:hypothetical protein
MRVPVFKPLGSASVERMLTSSLVSTARNPKGLGLLEVRL